MAFFSSEQSAGFFFFNMAAEQQIADKYKKVCKRDVSHYLGVNLFILLLP